MKTIIKVYKRHGWRWQMRDARNGKIIGASTEPNGYTRQAACLKNLERVTGFREMRAFPGDGSEMTVSLLLRDWEFP